MKIYFGAAITIDRDTYLPLYQKIVQQLESLGHEILSNHVVDPETELGDGLSAQELFNREVESVMDADVMVAEVTGPSWGTAFLIEHALENNKPVLALFYKNNGHELPLMVEGHPELYVANYNQDNLHAVLKKNLKQIEQQLKIIGKLIVIDGADGAGKATQTQLLLDYLKQQQIKNKYISFPRYHTSFHGHHVARFLKGEFGGNNEVSPYMSSLAFALDRLTARDEMIEWLEEGSIVVADRYTSANMAHQTSKLPQDKQKDFLKWLYEMEYKEHKLPKEDVVLFLHVPAEISQRLLDKKSDQKNNGGKRDQAESDLDHQRKSIAMYMKLAKKNKHWAVIECVEEGELLSKEQIHEKIIAVLKKRKVIG
jgi:dTMP kinase